MSAENKFVFDPTITLRENADVLIKLMEQSNGEVLDMVELVFEAGRLRAQMDLNTDDDWPDFENAVYTHFISSFPKH